MATFPNRNLNQCAVYWASPVADGYGGFDWDDPVEINCRWEGSSRIFIASNGEQMVSRAEVFTSQDLDEQGMLFLGELDDLDSSEEVDPTTITRAYQIKRFDKIPTIGGGKFLRKVYL